MKTAAAEIDILTHLGQIIEALEVRTSEQTFELMALVEAGSDSREAENALWRNIDSLLDLRRQQMTASAYLLEASTGKSF